MTELFGLSGFIGVVVRPAAKRRASRPDTEGGLTASQISRVVRVIKGYQDYRTSSLITTHIYTEKERERERRSKQRSID